MTHLLHPIQTLGLLIDMFAGLWLAHRSRSMGRPTIEVYGIRRTTQIYLKEVQR